MCDVRPVQCTAAALLLPPPPRCLSCLCSHLSLSVRRRPLPCRRVLLLRLLLLSVELSVASTSPQHSTRCTSKGQCRPVQARLSRRSRRSDLTNGTTKRKKMRPQLCKWRYVHATDTTSHTIHTAHPLNQPLTLCLLPCSCCVLTDDRRRTTSRVD